VTVQERDKRPCNNGVQTDGTSEGSERRQRDVKFGGVLLCVDIVRSV
jgi:hypothetical protein